METRPAPRRRTRVPSQIEAREEDAHRLTPPNAAAVAEDLAAQIDLAVALHDQAMSAADWEVASRNLRRARELHDSALRQLARDLLPRGDEQRLKAQCAALLAHVNHAASLLRLRLARTGFVDPSVT